VLLLEKSQVSCQLLSTKQAASSSSAVAAAGAFTRGGEAPGWPYVTAVVCYIVSFLLLNELSFVLLLCRSL
jgi:hypothetical protein